MSSVETHPYVDHRPETVESLFIAYRLTGDTRYRDYGWNIFQSIEKHCRIESGGYATILNVDEVPVQHEDKMETFLMVSCAIHLSQVIIGSNSVHQSETLKYLYLLFSDASVLPLNGEQSHNQLRPKETFLMEPLQNLSSIRR